MGRIGKGTGKYANRNRRTARRYLMDCVPRIPAWIMPLYKLWDSVEAVPGLFDTVIVDEASQAGIDALVLFLLAKRIVVVGDDKQNSPEAVGVLEDDMARLAHEHLNEFVSGTNFAPIQAFSTMQNERLGAILRSASTSAACLRSSALATTSATATRL
jgi:hypothetical protein